MSRYARFISEYMHVITRGIGKQILFEDDLDRQRFLHDIQRFSKETETTIIAYCLMENHVHLLLKNETRRIPEFMKKVGVSYAQYYNKKYERTGHLFQDRYKSEAVLSEEYLLTVFKYILNNPEKAGICAVSDYKWSSYKEYGTKSGITDNKIIKSIIGDKRKLRDFLGKEDDGECMEYMAPRRDDEWAKVVIRKTMGITSGSELQKYDRKQRDEALFKLKSKGISIRQIERLTGINRGIIQKAKGVK